MYGLLLLTAIWTYFACIHLFWYDQLSWFIYLFELSIEVRLNNNNNANIILFGWKEASRSYIISRILDMYSKSSQFQSQCHQEENIEVLLATVVSSWVCVASPHSVRWVHWVFGANITGFGLGLGAWSTIIIAAHQAVAVGCHGIADHGDYAW